MNARTVVVVCCLFLSGCSAAPTGDLAFEVGSHDEQADGFGVFVRSEGGGQQLWIDGVDSDAQVFSDCAKHHLQGIEHDGVFYPARSSGGGLCVAGHQHALDGPFEVDRSADGLTVGLGGQAIVFVRPTELPLAAPFIGSTLRVLDSSLPDAGDRGETLIRIDDDILKGRTDCTRFETTLTRTGSFFTTGDVRYSTPTCEGDEPLIDQLSNRAFVALGGDEGLALLFGSRRGFAVEVVDQEEAMDEQVGAPLDNVNRRSLQPVSGEFHAFKYAIDGEPKSTVASSPFRIRFDQDGGVIWDSDCNRTNATGRWADDAYVIQQAGTTAVGCPELFDSQGRDLTLRDQFTITIDGSEATLSSGSLAIDLMPGPPVPEGARIPAGVWDRHELMTDASCCGGNEQAAVTLRVKGDGSAALETGCRTVGLDLSGPAPVVTDVPESNCGRLDPVASVDIWIQQMLGDGQFVVYERGDSVIMKADGRGVRLHEQ